MYSCVWGLAFCSFLVLFFLIQDANAASASACASAEPQESTGQEADDYTEAASTSAAEGSGEKLSKAQRRRVRLELWLWLLCPLDLLHWLSISVFQIILNVQGCPSLYALLSPVAFSFVNFCCCSSICPGTGFGNGFHLDWCTGGLHSLILLCYIKPSLFCSFAVCSSLGSVSVLSVWEFGS